MDDPHLLSDLIWCTAHYAHEKINDEAQEASTIGFPQAPSFPGSAEQVKGIVDVNMIVDCCKEKRDTISFNVVATACDHTAQDSAQALSSYDQAATGMIPALSLYDQALDESDGVHDDFDRCGIEFKELNACSSASSESDVCVPDNCNQKDPAVQFVPHLHEGRQILVKTLAGKVIIIDAVATDTIGVVKAKIHDKGGMHPYLQRLMFADKLLETGRTLSDYDIRNDSCLQLYWQCEELAKRIEGAPANVQKQMIGEVLFPVVAAYQPGFAGMFTSTILDMDNRKIVNLLDSEQRLQHKVDELLKTSSVGETADAQQVSDTSSDYSTDAVLDSQIIDCCNIKAASRQLFHTICAATRMCTFFGKQIDAAVHTSLFPSETRAFLQHCVGKSVHGYVKYDNAAALLDISASPPSGSGPLEPSAVPSGPLGVPLEPSAVPRYPGPGGHVGPALAGGYSKHTKLDDMHQADHSVGAESVKHMTKRAKRQRRKQKVFASADSHFS